MLLSVCPKLPMRNKAITVDFYVNQLGFALMDFNAYPEYVILGKDGVELHFFLYKTLDPTTNYGQVYIRVKNIAAVYQNFLEKNIAIHPNAPLTQKPWGQKEFSLLDPDNNLLTFGEKV